MKAGADFRLGCIHGWYDAQNAYEGHRCVYIYVELCGSMKDSWNIMIHVARCALRFEYDLQFIERVMSRVSIHTTEMELLSIMYG